ncbi:endonuclease/exonuclease/phosphatase family protein [Novosphingobium sp. Gsoil 351]|uniref:endonuclease/exonuclease/phosphatase family protein n=1 Tax=Novosphingobium sp. Gsoil 351 TaxID=2675225 RepID=UPI0012B46196|nr:endonuclease/exonuclease/phosphatase family protein [Novosphingobium sp. Gsoil 351]QGN55816.1 endonuclease [Novosphingobium sp. Gsoil 351]
MARLSNGLVWAFALGVALIAGGAMPATPIVGSLPALPSASGDLSVLTYNVHGLPWFVAGDRSAALAAIGKRLRDLHEVGTAPRVAVVQEAFTPDAKAIAATSGYRYAAFGSGEHEREAAALPRGTAARSLEAGESWMKGEGVGKWEDSGLMILSDYPIVRVRRMAYSADACAGFDCLAAKGAMIAELEIPGGNVEVATTHMNSRHASGVSDDRANRAWLVQADELRDFIATRRNSALPLVLSGDLNVGRDIVRQLGLADLAAALDGHASDGLRALRADGAVLDHDATRALDHAKDWELAIGGNGTRLAPSGAWVPFGSDGGTPLSDHFGYAIRYRHG